MSVTRRQFIGLTAGLGLSAGLGFSTNTFAADDTITFAAINDIHVNDAPSVDIVNEAVIRINAIKEVEFAVIIGDLGSDGTRMEMKLAEAALKKLRVPYFCVPGNHDYDPTTANGYVHYDAAFEKRQWHQAQTGWVFLGLDSCNGTASDVTIPAARTKWLSEQLKGIREDQPIALFAHHPFNPSTRAYRVSNAEQVLDLFKDHDLRMVASGHYHGNQIEERNGILFTTTACCSTTRSNFDGTKKKGFRVYTLNGESIEHRFVEVPV